MGIIKEIIVQSMKYVLKLPQFSLCIQNIYTHYLCENIICKGKVGNLMIRLKRTIWP